MSEVMMQSPKIIVKLHESVLKETELTKPEFRIGRRPDNDLVIDDPAVSGHHARIIKIQAVFFVEDLHSTNGTFVNEHRIDRKQLKDTDVIKFGKYRVIYRDEVKSGPAPARPTVSAADHTMVLTGQHPRARSQAEQQVATVQIISGRTDRKEYTLSKHLTIIGAQENAAIKLTGWFATKTAAMIGRRGEGYFITTSKEGKKLFLNGVVVKGQADLKDGDLLEVVGVKMYFYLKPSNT